MSHHPWIVPEPFTPEPCETYSKEDIDYWAAGDEDHSDDAYESPQHSPPLLTTRAVIAYARGAPGRSSGMGGHLARLPAQAWGGASPQTKSKRSAGCGLSPFP